MKKLFIFKAFGTVLKELEDFEVNINIESVKVSLAVEKSLSYYDIEVEAKELNVPELSLEISVTADGLYYRANNPYAVFRKVDGLKPTQDIKTRSGFETFLEMISNKQIEDAITFH